MRRAHPARHVIACFIWTLVHLIANNNALAATFRGFRAAGWTFLGAHETLAGLASNFSVFFPPFLLQASAQRMSHPMLHPVAVLDITDARNATTSTLIFAIRCMAYNQSSANARDSGKRSRGHGASGLATNEVNKGSVVTGSHKFDVHGFDHV